MIWNIVERTSLNTLFNIFHDVIFLHLVFNQNKTIFCSLMFSHRTHFIKQGYTQGGGIRDNQAIKCLVSLIKDNL